MQPDERAQHRSQRLRPTKRIPQNSRQNQRRAGPVSGGGGYHGSREQHIPWSFRSDWKGQTTVYCRQ